MINGRIWSCCVLEALCVSCLDTRHELVSAQLATLAFDVFEVWSTGCILHILLSGQIPMVEEGDKGTEARQVGCHDHT